MRSESSLAPDLVPLVRRVAIEGGTAAMKAENAARKARLATLIEEHGRFLWRSLRRLGVPDRSLDDAVQQVFLVVALRLDEITPGAEKAFLFRSAVNVAAHVRRKRIGEAFLRAQPSEIYRRRVEGVVRTLDAQEGTP